MLLSLRLDNRILDVSVMAVCSSCTPGDVTYFEKKWTEESATTRCRLYISIFFM